MGEKGGEIGMGEVFMRGRCVRGRAGMRACVCVEGGVWSWRGEAVPHGPDSSRLFFAFYPFETDGRHNYLQIKFYSRLLPVHALAFYLSLHLIKS